MKMTPEVYEAMKADILAVSKAINLPPDNVGHMWSLLHIVAQNRAYDDSHPAFVEGQWKRILPYDGRDYCWYYKAGLNDSHVTTALKSIFEECEWPVREPVEDLQTRIYRGEVEVTDADGVQTMRDQG